MKRHEIVHESIVEAPAAAAEREQFITQD